MNFDAYTDLSVVTAVDLVNTLDVETGKDFLTGPDHLAKFLDDHLDSYARPLTPADVTDIQGLRERLRLAFTLGSIDTVVDLLNDLLAESSALPQLTDHDGVWHFHFTPPESSLFAHMAAEAAMGLASVIRDHGLERLRVQQGVDARPAQAKQLACIGPHSPQRGPRDDWREHVSVANRGPQGECLLDELRGGDVGARGEVGRVERAHARTHEDRRALPTALELGQQYRQRAHLVGAAGSTAR